MTRGALAVTAGLVLVAAIVLFFVYVKAYRIPSSAMEPTLRCARPAPGCSQNHADRVLALRLAWPFGHVGRGDVVFFHTPRLAAERCGAAGTFVKRVVGVPGETWRERRGTILIDSRPLREPYVTRRDSQSFRGGRIPAGAYLLLGDNRASSCDSRVFGAVPRGKLIARLIAVYFPPGRIGFR